MQMTIHQARHIAQTIDDRAGDVRFFRDEIHAAFHKLHQNSERSKNADIRKADRRLAKVIWDFVGTWN